MKILQEVLQEFRSSREMKYKIGCVRGIEIESGRRLGVPAAFAALFNS